MGRRLEYNTSQRKIYGQCTHEAALNVIITEHYSTSLGKQVEIKVRWHYKCTRIAKVEKANKKCWQVYEQIELLGYGIVYYILQRDP